MKKLFIIILILTASISLYAFDITKNGKPAADIIIKPNAADAEKYATMEFIKYIKQISGADLKVSQNKFKNKIYIQSAGDETKQDSVSIKAKGNNLYIEGMSPRSTIYAVYELLVKYLNCEFYTRDTEKITKNKNIIIPDTEYIYTPPFFSRECFYKGNLAFPEFAVKQKLNGKHNYIDEKLGGSIDLIHWCHSTCDYISEDKYYKDHPEYFALVKGERKAGAKSQLCWTNQEMRVALAKEVINFLRQFHNPKIIDVSQMDNTVYCQCENCQKALKKYGSPAGALIEMINFVADEVKKVYPNVYVETLAYQHTLSAPTNIKTNDNVIIRVCDIECNFAEPIREKSSKTPYEYVNGRHFPYTDYNTINRDFAENIEKWSRICNRIYIWDYTVNFNNYHIVHPNLQVLQPNLQYFRDHNAVAIFEQGDYFNESSTFNEMKNFLIGKLLWNPDEDFEALRLDFCENVYGKGYKEILQVQNIYTEAIQKKNYFLPTYVDDMDWMSEEDFIKSIKLFQSALRKTENTEKEHRKIYTAYIDFVSGAYTKNNERQKNIAQKCNLPWKNKEEFDDYFIDYCEETGNYYASESKPFVVRNNPYKLKKSDKILPFCKDSNWFEIDNKDFMLKATGKETYDKEGTYENVTWLYPTQAEWSMQRNFGGNIYEFKTKGCKSIDFYLVCKSVNKKNNTGNVATFGIWDESTKTNLFTGNIPINKLNDQSFSAVYLGNWNIKKSRSPLFYICGVNNPCADAVAIDRVIGIIR